ncbi:androgen-induced gene 1 protein-like isoform X1 [Acropora palmata]|uniref:androgen-induced gene 1 protein-like isoform X1 n=1 Tax=Acropora palmata TaxID=6131 RepID=UPI003DA031B6
MASSSSFGILLISHICGTMLFTYTLYQHLQIKAPVNRRYYGGKFKFLTFLNVLIQLVYFTTAIIGDVVTLIKGRDGWLTKLRDIVFASLAFPICMFVSATFWGIYLMDRDLIFPKGMEEIIPPWLNHLLHTWCAVAIIMEGAFVKHRYPRNHVGLGLLLSFCLAYLLWITWVSHVTGFWVYPFLHVMSFSARIASVALAGFAVGSFYFFGKRMTRFIFGAEEQEGNPMSKNSN